MASRVEILNATALPDSKLTVLRSAVERAFGLPSTVHAGALDLTPAFDPSRCQYNSTVLLSQVIQLGSAGMVKRIAVVEVDLCVPVLTFVFGEAQLSGNAAVVSIHRLATQFYGLQPDEALLLRRLETEAIHELGHTFGLRHCRQFECVMRSSTDVEEIDLKRPTFCRSCKQLVGTG